MTYRDLIRLRDVLIETILTQTLDMPEEERIPMMKRIEAACKEADDYLFNEQLPILLGDKEKAEAVRMHLDDQVAGQ